jgi:hypothetical protein
MINRRAPHRYATLAPGPQAEASEKARRRLHPQLKRHQQMPPKAKQLSWLLIGIERVAGSSGAPREVELWSLERGSWRGRGEGGVGEGAREGRSVGCWPGWAHGGGGGSGGEPRRRTARWSMECREGEDWRRRPEWAEQRATRRLGASSLRLRLPLPLRLGGVRRLGCGPRILPWSRLQLSSTPGWPASSLTRGAGETDGPHGGNGLVSGCEKFGLTKHSIALAWQQPLRDRGLTRNFSSWFLLPFLLPHLPLFPATCSSSCLVTSLFCPS